MIERLKDILAWVVIFLVAGGIVFLAYLSVAEIADHWGYYSDMFKFMAVCMGFLGTILLIGWAFSRVVDQKRAK